MKNKERQKEIGKKKRKCFFFLQESETKKLKRKRKTIGRPKYVINKMKINIETEIWKNLKEKGK